MVGRSSNKGRHKNQKVAQKTDAICTLSPRYDEGYREVVLKIEYLFDRDHPELYKKVKSLLEKELRRRERPMPDDDELRFKLGEVVYKYHGRHNNPHYFNNIKQFMRQAQLVADSLRRMVLCMPSIDHSHRELFGSVLQQMLPHFRFQGLNVDSGHNNFMTWMTLTQDLMETTFAALKLSTSEDPNWKVRRGHPRLPYHFATSELMDLWLVLSGEWPVYPKAQANDVESGQASTEFIRLGLTMIDSKITFSKVQTSIKNVLKSNKKIIDAMRESGVALQSDDFMATFIELYKALVAQKKQGK